jgi:hypothetical protein
LAGAASFPLLTNKSRIDITWRIAAILAAVPSNVTYE